MYKTDYTPDAGEKVCYWRRVIEVGLTERNKN